MPTDLADVELDKLTTKSLGGLKVEPVTQELSFINILVYGPSGVGKTTLAGSASIVEAMSPVLFVDIEGGTLSLKQAYPNVEKIRVKTWDQMQKVYDDLHAGHHSYKTVVLDSLTEIAKFSMLQIMEDLVKENEDRDPDVPGMREWGKNIEQTRKFVRAFRDLPMHTIFTALSQADRDPRTGMTLTKPSLSGKLSGEVAGFLDIVCYYYIKEIDNENKRFLLTSQTASAIAKDRSGLLPQVVEAPTMTTLFNTITGVSNA